MRIPGSRSCRSPLGRKVAQLRILRPGADLAHEPAQLYLNDKYFMADVGIRHGLIGYSDGDIAGPLENVVYLELLRAGDLPPARPIEKQGAQIALDISILPLSPPGKLCHSSSTKSIQFSRSITEYEAFA